MQAPISPRASTVLVLVLLTAGFLRIPNVSAAGAAQLTAIQHTVAPDRTRVVLDLSSQAAYEVRSYERPYRVAVNLRGVEASGSLHPVEINEGVVRRIRVNRLPWGTQVVFDLRSGARSSDLYLQPVDGMPDRILIDLAESGPGVSAGETGIGGQTGDSSEKGEAPAGRADLSGGDGAGEAPAFSVGATSAASDGEPQRVLVVAVDAGHGGHDSGAKGNRGLVEKDLALDIARRAARTIDGTKGYRAVMTRDRDVFLDLVQRTQIAKRKDADIFVSVHLNTAPRKNARGVEVWFISPAGAEATARKLVSNGQAARELGLEEPENSDVIHMLVDVNQQAMMQRSLMLAEEILKAADRVGLPPGRSVKQQSFAVLKSIDMPSVLVEGGFLSNSKDSEFLRKPEGRQAVADAVAAGAIGYLKKYPPPRSSAGTASARQIHKVKDGETLWAISKKYNTSVAAIRKSNGMAASDVLRVGQELVIRANHDDR